MLREKISVPVGTVGIQSDRETIKMCGAGRYRSLIGYDLIDSNQPAAAGYCEDVPGFERLVSRLNSRLLQLWKCHPHGQPWLTDAVGEFERGIMQFDDAGDNGKA